jgi:hypothetical protein
VKKRKDEKQKGENKSGGIDGLRDVVNGYGWNSVGDVSK